MEPHTYLRTFAQRRPHQKSKCKFCRIHCKGQWQPQSAEPAYDGDGGCWIAGMEADEREREAFKSLIIELRPKLRDLDISGLDQTCFHNDKDLSLEPTMTVFPPSHPKIWNSVVFPREHKYTGLTWVSLGVFTNENHLILLNSEASSHGLMKLSKLQDYTGEESTRSTTCHGGSPSSGEMSVRSERDSVFTTKTPTSSNDSNAPPSLTHKGWCHQGSHGYMSSREQAHGLPGLLPEEGKKKNEKKNSYFGLQEEKNQFLGFEQGKNGFFGLEEGKSGFFGFLEEEFKNGVKMLEPMDEESLVTI